MDSLSSTSASVQSSSNSDIHLMRTKASLLSLLSDSSQSSYAASVSANQINSVNRVSQARQKIHSFGTAMDVLSNHRLMLSMASNSSTVPSFSSELKWKQIQQALSQLNSNVQELQKYLNSRL